MSDHTPSREDVAKQGAVEDFLAYCEQELQRRRYSEPDFDSERYDEAMQLVLSKLRPRGEGER